MLIRSGDAEICTEAFGNESDPPVLLIMGMMASMLWWPDGFCERLAAQGRRVIRYDNRDTGRSTSYEPGAPPYSGQAFIDDAIAVLDAYGAERAHVVGMSMGGGIAQEVAMLHPDRVATLTVISTSPLKGPGGLPGPEPAYLEHLRTLDADWDDPDSIAAMLLKDMRALSSTRHPFDEAATRAQIERDLERTARPASLQNHQLVEGPETPEGEITAPVLAIHGTTDPMFPIAHGEAFGAPLVRIEGGGHELHPGDWDEIVAAIARHTA